MKYIAIILVRGYQKLFRPILGSNCRFYPSCSDYMILAIEHNGFFKGFTYGVKRIMRCNPYTQGGFDYPPNVNEKDI